MAMTELRSRVGERERKRERSKERGNEERTDDGMDQGEEGSEKGPLVGEGGNVTEVGVVSTAPHCRALSPLLALPPPPSSLERALYF